MNDRRLHRKQIGLACVSLVILLSCLRAFSEISMMVEYGTDAQMPIWVMAMIFKLCGWLAAGIACAAMVTFSWPKMQVVFPVLTLYLIWTLAICMASRSYFDATRALADASDPLTTPKRLHDLVSFSGVQAGYRLDNRIAVHPNTLPDDLRWLYHRGQYGTLVKLASNPNTPDDILGDFTKKGDALIAHSLRLNPRFSTPDQSARQPIIPTISSEIPPVDPLD